MPGLADRTFVQKVSDALAILGVGGGGTGATFVQEFTLSGAAELDLTGFPATARHLQLLASCRSSRAVSDASLEMRINADATGNYQPIQWEVDSASQQVENSVSNSVRFEIADCPGSTNPLTVHQVINLMIYNYQSTAQVKNMVGVAHGPIAFSAGNMHVKSLGFTYNSLSAITQITLRDPSSPFNLEATSNAMLIGWGST